jgi:Cu(I)/Ag(I) efflux system periplasmic protein CusF
MNTVLARLLATAALTALSSVAFAQGDDMVDGEVRKIDKAQSKITLKHGEIKKLDMPPMTMVFRAKDAKLLEGLAVGDKIKFAAQQIDGAFVVTQVTKAP